MQNNINIRKYNAYFITVFILSIFSTYYLGKIYLPLWIFFFVFALLMFFILTIYKAKIFSFRQLFLPIIYICFTLLSQIVLLNNKEHLGEVFSVVTPILFYILSITLSKKLNEREIIFILKFIVFFAIPLLFCEAIYRIFNPIYIIDGIDYRLYPSLFFYAYKFNSILFEDSNFVGVMIVVLFSLTLYLEQLLMKKLTIIKMLLFILVILTVSRAAIIVVISTYFFIIFRSISSKTIKYCIGFIGIFIGFIVLLLILKDDSFNSKLWIFYFFKEFIENSSIFTLLFGLGIGQNIELHLINHNILFQHISQEGIVGFLLLLVFWIQTIKKSNYKNLYIFVPLIILGMSVVGHTIAYFYVIIALIQNLESRRSNIAK